MSQYCSFRVGGKVDYFVLPSNLQQLVVALFCVQQRGFPFFVLGNGSNVIFRTRPSVKFVFSLKNFEKICTRQGLTVTASANINLFDFNKFLLEKGLGGFEFSFGIPASIGGAIKCNAGAFGGEVCNFVQSITILDLKTLTLRKIKKADIKFSYRKTNIEGIILWATFKFFKQDAGKIKKLQQNYLLQRKNCQPYEFCSAGSVFKRDGSVVPAFLIDQAGLKGLQIGGAQVSQKHAGFVIKALPDCTSDDILRLLRLVKHKIKSRFGIDLKEEVLIV